MNVNGLLNMEFKKCIFYSMIVLLALLTQGCSKKKDLESPARRGHDVIYHIVNVHDRADFNYQLINEYKSLQPKWGGRENVIELFRPVNGKHRVIEFTAAFWGIGKDEKEKLFHEILILKVDHNNVILDGLQYTLEWASPPLIYDIYSLKSNEAKLTENLNLSDLQFGSLLSESEPYLAGDRPPTGILDNVYNFEKQF